MTRLNRKTGFTLIELLVTIAIIAIIAAILFPVFARAREKARQTVCMSNLKQLGIAWRMYADDHDETFPLYMCNTRGNMGYCAICPPFAKHPTAWPVAMWPYYKNSDILVCPSSREVIPQAPHSLIDRTTTPHSAMSYNTNGMVMERSLAGIPEPSRSVILVCHGWTNGQLGYRPFKAPWTSIGWDCASYPRQHNGGANVLFVDGHVKWLIPEQFSYYPHSAQHGHLFHDQAVDILPYA